jgi:xylulokinase
LKRARKKTFIIAVDCGSTNFKAALLNQDGEKIAQKSLPLKYEKNREKFKNISPLLITKISKRLLEDAVKAAKIPQHSITDIAVTSQAQTFLAVDKKYNALTPLISWIDARAKEEAAELNKKFSSKICERATFPLISPQMTAAKLLWIKKYYPILRRNAGWRIMFLPEWVMFALTGNHITDSNLAAMSGLYSLKLDDWYGEMLKELEITSLQLPEVLNAGEKKRVKLQRSFANEWLSEDLSLVSAGNDQTAGAFGNSIREDEPLITLGTALVVYRLENKKGPYGNKTAWGPFPFGGYYELATLTEGCLALDWAKNKIFKDRPIQEFEGLAKLFFDKHKNKLDNKLFFYPQRIENGQAWLNASYPIDALAYSAFEGITFTLRKLMEESLKKQHLKNICVTGGGSASDFWLSLIASALNCKVRRGKGDAVLGAGMMALKKAKSLIGEGYYTYLHSSEPHASQLLENRYKLWKKYV